MEGSRKDPGVVVAAVGLRSIVGHFTISLSDGSWYHGNQSICLFPSRQKTSREETVRKVKTAHIASLCAPGLVAPLGELEARRSLCAAEGQRHATH